ncbi:MAG: hypothetical protein ABF461_08495 [Zymomonas mobilis subsp. pomaceae]|uniref:hypothetical protein n=1 Tax=Zymomonas mobilis TaxID=542 RepID=UPI0039E83C02
MLKIWVSGISLIAAMITSFQIEASAHSSYRYGRSGIMRNYASSGYVRGYSRSGYSSHYNRSGYTPHYSYTGYNHGYNPYNHNPFRYNHDYNHLDKQFFYPSYPWHSYSANRNQYTPR